MKITKIILSSILLLLSLHMYAQNERPNVTGGQEVDIDRRPFQGSIQTNSRHFCGCSIVNNRYVVTAAHCVQGRTAASLRVAVGVTEQSQVGRSGQLVNVSSIRVHPGYNASTSNNDIAVLELASNIDFNANVQPIRIVNEPNRNLISVGRQTTVSGWGWTIPGQSSAPNHLHQVTTPIIASGEAQRQLGRTVNNNMIATGYVGNRQGACHGDSGGPLTGNDSRGIPYLIGVVSWGTPQCPEGPNSPSVYVNVINYQNWIYNEICRPAMTVSGGIFSDVLLEASSEVRYSGVIQSQAIALLRAGQQVILTNGFQARPTGRGEVIVGTGGNCISNNTRTTFFAEKSGAIDSEAVVKGEGLTITTVFPNPFTSELTVSYFVEEKGIINLTVYNLAGNQVRHIIDHEVQEAGNHAVAFDVSQFPTGIYIYCLKVNDQETKGKLIKR